MKAERLARSIAARTLLGALAGGVLVYLYAAVLAPTDPTELAENETPYEELVLGAVLMPVGFVVIRNMVRSSLGWLDEERAPTEQEREALLRQSWRISILGIALWLVAAVIVTIFNLITDGTASENVHSAAAVLFGGLVNTAVGFGLRERALRPLYALALEGRPPDALGSLGIRARVLLAWALASAVPMLAIALAPLGRSAEERADLSPSTWFLVAVGIVAGAVTIAGVAGAMADRLQAARAALARVREGDLDVNLPVDDGSEVGSLQAGFNEMASGLRERRRLQDLFGRHVGAEVARRALERGVLLGGEQREVSVLFVDLVGSTGLAQELDPDQVVGMLNDFFAAVVASVGEEGGWVNKFAGDGALCVFGAPEDQPDHARRTLAAARRLRRAIGELAVAHPMLDAGIGVSCGLVVAGNVGAEERFEYTVIGDPVNEAARLTEEAKHRPARVLASSQAVRAAGDEAAAWRAAGTATLRGRSEPTELYEPASNG